MILSCSSLNAHNFYSLRRDGIMRSASKTPPVHKVVCCVHMVTSEYVCEHTFSFLMAQHPSGPFTLTRALYRPFFGCLFCTVGLPEGSSLIVGSAPQPHAHVSKCLPDEALSFRMSPPYLFPNDSRMSSKVLQIYSCSNLYVSRTRRGTE